MAVSEGVGEVGLADSDGAEDEHGVAGLGEAQAGQVHEQLPVVAEVVELVPGLDAHGGVQAGGAGAQLG